MKVKYESTQELVDQVYLALNGKVRFVEQPMLMRDETNIGYKFYESRHHPEVYLTQMDFKRIRSLVSRDFKIKNLELGLDIIENMWSPMDEKHSNSKSIFLARHEKYYSPYKGYDGQSVFSGRLVRFIAKIGIVVSEIVSWPLTRRALNTVIGKNVIKKFTKSIPTHSVYK